MNYIETLKALEDGSLDPRSFSHKDHLGVAFEALKQFDFFEASHRVARGLQQVTQTAGVPEKFNATVTHAFMSVIAERCAMTEFKDAETFLDSNADLLEARYLSGLFSKELLASDLAKIMALRPDVT